MQGEHSESRGNKTNTSHLSESVNGKNSFFDQRLPVRQESRQREKEGKRMR
jgi:hypothetical protein